MVLHWERCNADFEVWLFFIDFNGLEMLFIRYRHLVRQFCYFFVGIICKKQSKLKLIDFTRFTPWNTICKQLDNLTRISRFIYGIYNVLVD